MMKRFLLAAAAIFVLILAMTSAYACGDRYRCPTVSQNHSIHHPTKHPRRYHVTHRRAHKKSPRPGGQGPAQYGGLVTVQTAVNIPITVSAAIKDRMLSLIEDMKAHGYIPHQIGCYARGGHVRNSRHYSGNACDFDGSLSVARFFRSEEAEVMIRAHGLHSGCDYHLHGTRDCGHVDDMTEFAHLTRHHHYRAYARR